MVDWREGTSPSRSARDLLTVGSAGSPRTNQKSGCSTVVPELSDRYGRDMGDFG